MSTEAVGLYLRLSREDEERITESESIKNQRDFLIEYTEKMNWKIHDIYTDDGYSGTNFERPGFKRLLNDIENKKINIVVTKDLSRLGRDYIQTGFYMEKYFPSMGVRYIAVNDGIDTANTENSFNDMSPFKSVINDMYAKDISKKVRTALTTKKKNGIFIGSFAPYGYLKDTENKGHLLIDEKTAPVVKEIFRLFLEGYSLYGIAKHLTEENIDTPGNSRAVVTSANGKAGSWNDSTVRRILTNETYIGNLTQNRCRKISYKIDKKVNLRKNEWIISHDTHVPVISRDDFYAVQRLLSERSYVKKEIGKAQHLLSGIVYCGNCGSTMTFLKEGPGRTYIVCSNWRRKGKGGECSSHCIREDYVENLIMVNLRELFKKPDTHGVIQKVLDEDNTNDKYRGQLDGLCRECRMNEEVQLSLYRDKVKGIIGIEQFNVMNKKLIEEYKILSKKLQDVKNRIVSSNNTDRKRRAMEEFLELNNIKRNFLVLLINRVNIYGEKRVEIVFNFRNPL